MTVDTCKKLVEFICNKNQSGAPSPAEFNRVITAAARAYQSFLLGQEEQYQPGRPQPRVGLGSSQAVRQSLAPLIDAPSALTIASGRVAYPPDLEAVDAMYQSDGYSKIRFVEQDRVQAYVESVIDPIAQNPIYLLEADGFLFYPASLTAAKLSYVKTHPDIVWNYTLDGNGRAVYNATGSTHPLFSDTDMMQVIARALRLIGVNLQAGAVSQYAQEVKAAGQ